MLRYKYNGNIKDISWLPKGESVKRGNRNGGNGGKGSKCRNVYQKKVDQKYFIHKSYVLIGSAASANFLEQLVVRNRFEFMPQVVQTSYLIGLAGSF